MEEFDFVVVLAEWLRLLLKSSSPSPPQTINKTSIHPSIQYGFGLESGSAISIGFTSLCSHSVTHSLKSDREQRLIDSTLSR